MSRGARARASASARPPLLAVAGVAHGPPECTLAVPVRECHPRWTLRPSLRTSVLAPLSAWSPPARFAANCRAAAAGRRLPAQCSGARHPSMPVRPGVLPIAGPLAAHCLPVAGLRLGMRGVGGWEEGRGTPGNHHAAHALVRRGLAAGGPAARHRARAGASHAGHHPGQGLSGGAHVVSFSDRALKGP